MARFWARQSDHHNLEGPAQPVTVLESQQIAAAAAEADQLRQQEVEAFKHQALLQALQRADPGPEASYTSWAAALSQQQAAESCQLQSSAAGSKERKHLGELARSTDLLCFSLDLGHGSGPLGVSFSSRRAGTVVRIQLRLHR